jgi:hypothetical protein
MVSAGHYPLNDCWGCIHLGELLPNFV